MLDRPTFSVVVTDYEPSIPRDLFRRKMRCLAEQTCADFEVLVYHDGPKSVPYHDDVAGAPISPRTRFTVTDKRANDWGHSNRDRGIREARGDWIVHTNADNVFYPTLIETLKRVATDSVTSFRQTQKRLPMVVKSIAKRVDKRFGTNLRDVRLQEVGEKQILIYAVQMRGMLAIHQGAVRVRERALAESLIFGGVPVLQGHIDAMQLVMRRDLWLAEGGWYDRSERSDGIMYERFARKYAMRVIPEVLGEHW